MCEFCHLHCHTHYSLNDALPSPKELAHKMRKMGFTAGAITDHGRMGGCPEFYLACKDDKVDAPPIKPILGVEAYTCPDRHVKESVIRDDGKKGRPKSHHLTLLAQNATGYRNLLRLQSIASEEGYYYEPRMDWEAIKDHSEGVIALSGCLGSEFNSKLRREDIDGARQVMERFKDVFEDRYYCELHNHGIDEQKKILRHQVNLAKELDVPILAANDVHYIEPEDWEIHDVFFQLRDQNKTGNEPANGKRQAYSSKQFWLKNAEEMALRFKPAPEALSNTVVLAERIEDFMKLDTPHLLPTSSVPTDDEQFQAFYKRQLPYHKPNEAYLAYLTFRGLKMIGKDKDKAYIERCKSELEQIWFSGVTDYFLIQYEAVQYMKANDILYGIRGSGVGSLVNYCLKISSMDPVRWNLQFARFLNPGRGTQYDIDFKHYSFKQYASEHEVGDQLQSMSRLRELAKLSKERDESLAPHGPEISKELWAIDNQGLASYLCFLADNNLTSRTNDAQLWVAYFLGITDQKPETVMRIKKVSTLPDVDTDVDDRYRDSLINWARDRFGEDKVKVIGAYGTFQARAAVKGALKVSDRFRQQYGEKAHVMSEVVSKTIPAKIEVQAEAEGIDDVLQYAADLAPDFAQHYKRWDKEMSIAKRLIDKVANLQVHASGVLIASEPIRDHSPLDNSKTTICSAYDMEIVDRFGLVKYDYLGLRMYQKLSRAIKMIARNHNVKIELADIPLDDPKVYRLFSLGHTNSTFQFSSDGMKDSLKQVGADNLEDLIAIVALFRPGPLKFIPQYAKNKRSPEDVQYPHAIVEKYLKVTHGIVVYQEQAMFMAQELAGFNWDEVEKVRKTVSKKDPEGFAKISAVLTEKAIKRGIPAKTVNETVALTKNFAGYAFNRCHAGSYALLAYWTGYLRTYYPSEWLAACLHTDRDKKDHVAAYRRDADVAGIKVIAADVNYSRLDADVLSDGNIIMPLSSLNGVGGTADSIIEQQPYDSLRELVMKVGPNRGTIQAIAEGSGLRSLPDCKNRSVEEIMELVDEYTGQRKSAERSEARIEKMRARIESPLFDMKLTKTPIIKKPLNSSTKKKDEHK
jgi:DNA polymerase-3 subunit alpha